MSANTSSAGELGTGFPPSADAAQQQAAGLTQAEVTRRLGVYGFNEIRARKASAWRKLLSYFWGPIPWMIEAAAMLSALVHRWPDFGIILVLLVMNAGVGFWEEYQAGNAIAALKAGLALKARVKRDGKWRVVAARELVPGDLIRVRLGDIVPADVTLTVGDPVEVDQSALTGESLPVTRAAGESLYSGSILKRGEADAVVTATGPNTYFGRTAHLVETAHTASHFQQAVLKIGDYLIALAIGLVLLILAVALFRGDNMRTTLQFALVLTVAAIPVAMPAVLSVTMAVGARLLAAKQAIVSRLAAIEELAGMDVLCADKTGTLTQNRLTCGPPFVMPGVNAEEVRRAAALASRAEDQDPIDLAVLAGIKVTDSYTIVRFQAFDPVSKRTQATVRTAEGRVFEASKGAPQVIATLASSKGMPAELEEAVNGFARRGYRSLAVSQTDDSGQWQLLGILPLFDPPREDSRATIATANQMGVRVKMVTGDQAAIAREIASQLGLGKNILAPTLLAADVPASRLSDAVEDGDGFAQVFPEHKYTIVEALQSRGHITGMTGDGVNDAPALKKADAGIAVAGATDAARAAADIVLLAPGLSVVIDGIKEARKIFQRMNSYVTYRIAETIRVLLFMTLSILIFNFYPVTAVMIVLLALLNDGPILAIAYDRTRPSPGPESWRMHTVLGVATVLGLVGVISSFGLFYLAERTFHLSRDVIQSFMFLKLAVAGHLTIFITRTRGPFWSIRPAPSLLWAAVGTKLIATLAAVYGWLMVPIGWKWALLIWGYALAWFLVNDGIKLLAYRLFAPAPALATRLSAVNTSLARQA